MSEQLPPQDFGSQHYERPNQKWICGHACEGQSCRLGPSHRGHCRATAECVPVLEKAEGEAKGRWRCTRAGGACENGPLPDGSCCRPVARCSPVPTLRTVRGRATWAVVAATAALLLIAMGSSWRGRFINPGGLSAPHSGEAFAKLHASTNRASDTCAACHDAGGSGVSGMITATFHAKPGLLDLKGLAGVKTDTVTAIDAACQKCHQTHSLHQRSLPRDVSCSYCHAEHQGTAALSVTKDSHCAFCHGDAALMATSSLKGSSMTQVTHSFAGDHPEFRVHAEKRRDPNSLKFNHALHLGGGTIPKLPGNQKLDCIFCHQPDASGTFIRPVRFESNCRVCHSLQFDVETPELNLPHGNPEFVSAFLRSLPKQYADLAARSGVTGAEPQKQFVQQKIQRLQAEAGSGEALEKRVFFSTALAGPEANVGSVSGATRALYPGCVYCHDVKPAPRGGAEITKPVIAERWLKHGAFDHASHAKVACTQCHDAVRSKDTADIILPTKESCASCHSPRGGAADTCVTCHKYHRPK